MLIPSKKLFYAIEAVLYIATHGQPIKADKVADAQGLPVRYLEPTLQKLVRAGILCSVRGPSGGYVLGMSINTMTLGDVYNVLDAGQDFKPKTKVGRADLQAVLNIARFNLGRHLATVTIASLL